MDEKTIHRPDRDISNDLVDCFGGEGLSITHVHANGMHVLSTYGYVDLSTLRYLDHAVATVSEARPRRLVVDLSGLNFFSATGASLLLAASRRLGRGRLAVVIEPDRVATKHISIIDPNGELSIYQSLRAALAGPLS